MKSPSLDVAIIGGGLAGNLLARQLHLTTPQLNVGIFEKNRDTSFKVGEATVEIFSNYLIRRLGLSRYLYEHHLPKNGLRFFFDTANKNASLEEMSEVGGTALPFHPSFQLDRARLEADLQKMNGDEGVKVFLETRVHDISLEESSQSHKGHQFLATYGGVTDRYSCRWLIDASGRSSLIAKKLQLRTSEDRHCMGAMWGRFRFVDDIDAVGREAFRRRVRYTTRTLSTNHFCYPGYWIWFIPLGKGITSVGVVMDHSFGWNSDFRKKEGFLSFLSQHQAPWSLLRNAELMDIGSYEHLSYGTQQFFSADRWGLTGEAAAFSDPFYSPGADFIALENDFLTDLISRDTQGESYDQIATRAELYNQYMLFRVEASMRLYRQLYGLLGSFELLRLKWQLDFPLYYQLWVSQYMQDRHLDETFLVNHQDEHEMILNVLSNFSDLFRKAEQVLHQDGTYYKSNCSQFAHALEGMNWVEEIGHPQTQHQQFKRLGEILNRIRGQALDLIERGEGNISRETLPLSRFLSKESLM